MNASNLSSIALILAALTPFAIAPNLYFANSTIKLAAWCATIIVAAISFFALKKNERVEVIDFYRDPIVLLYCALIIWLILRSLPSWSTLAWWGDWTRTDGIWMQISWLLFLPFVAWRLQYVGAPRLEQASRVFSSRFFVGFALVLLFGTTFLAPLLPTTGFWSAFSGQRWGGFLGNAIYLSGLLVFAPWLAANVFGNTNENSSANTNKRISKIRFWSITITIALTFFALYKTELRGAAIAAAVGIGVWLFEWLRTKEFFGAWQVWKKIVCVAGVLMLIAISFFVVRIATDARFFDINPKSFTAQTRIALWKSGWESFKLRPIIGYGVGEHLKQIERSAIFIAPITAAEASFDTTHSAYIDLVLQGGVIALILFFAWSIYLYLRMRDLPQFERPFARASFVAYLTLSATSFFTPYAAIPFLFLCAVILRQKKNQSAVAVVFTKIIVYATWVIVFATAIYTAATVISSSWELQKILDESRLTGDIKTFGESAAAMQKNWFPFAIERDIRLVRTGSALLAAQLENSDRGAFDSQFVPMVEKFGTRADLLSEYDSSLAVFANVYAAASGTARDVWLERAENWQMRALEKNPDRPMSIFQLADTLRERGRDSEAVNLLKDFRSRHTDIPEAFFYASLMESIEKDREAGKDALSAAELRTAAYWGESRAEFLKEVMRAANLKLPVGWE